MLYEDCEGQCLKSAQLQSVADPQVGCPLSPPNVFWCSTITPRTGVTPSSPFPEEKQNKKGRYRFASGCSQWQEAESFAPAATWPSNSGSFANLKIEPQTSIIPVQPQRHQHGTSVVCFIFFHPLWLLCTPKKGLQVICFFKYILCGATPGSAL